MYNNHQTYKFYFILLLALISINLLLSNLNYNADTLFPYRYIHALFSERPSALIIQPGPRFFPELIYATVAYTFTDSKDIHMLIVMFINSIVLCSASLFFFFILTGDKKQSAYYTATLLVLIPVVNIFSNCDIKYILYSPGIHGFSIAYQLILYTITLSFLQKNQLKINLLLVYLLLGCMCSINDKLFLISTILPIIVAFGFIWIFNIRKFKNFDVISFAVSNLIILAVTMKGPIIWNSFDSLSVLSIGTDYFENSFFDWFSTHGMKLFIHFFRFDRTGIIAYIVISSILYSSYILIKNHKSMLLMTKFVNILNLIWIPIALLAMWAIDKGAIRLIPYVFLLSPMVFLYNIKKTFFDVRVTNILMIICIVTIVNTLIKNISISEKHNPRFSELLDKLSYLRESGKINSLGLASYWVAWSGTEDYNFKIPSISNKGSPSNFASDSLSYWAWEKGKHNRENYTFIVNRFRTKKNSWSLESKYIFDNFGMPEDTIKFVDYKARKYDIYIYPNGMKTEKLYQEASEFIRLNFKEIWRQYFDRKEPQ